MDGKLSGSPNFFFFRGEGYAYLNGPPVPHERTAHRSRHSLVKTSRIFTFGGVCGGGCSRCCWPFLSLVCCRILSHAIARPVPTVVVVVVVVAAAAVVQYYRTTATVPILQSHRCAQTEHSELNSRPK
jgi:hypothetical protein